MRQRHNKPRPGGGSPQIAFRMDPPVFERFERVVTASKLSKTSIIEECLEKVLPQLEKQYLKAA